MGRFPIRPCSERGLAGRRVSATPVGSYSTISPLPGSASRSYTLLRCAADSGLAARSRPRRYVSVPLSVGSPRLAFRQRSALRADARGVRTFLTGSRRCGCPTHSPSSLYKAPSGKSKARPYQSARRFVWRQAKVRMIRAPGRGCVASPRLRGGSYDVPGQNAEFGPDEGPDGPISAVDSAWLPLGRRCRRRREPLPAAGTHRWEPGSRCGGARSRAESGPRLSREPWRGWGRRLGACPLWGGRGGENPKSVSYPVWGGQPRPLKEIWSHSASA